MTAAWIPTHDRLPEPSEDTLYLLTLDWGHGRPLQLTVGRFRCNPGNESRGHWSFGYHPFRVIPSGVVRAWQPAPAFYRPYRVKIGGTA